MGENGMSDNMFSTTPQAMEGGIDNLIGAATAYADAVAAGYTGTREQWAEDMAKLGENLAEARVNRKAAEDAAQDAEYARDAAVNARDTAVSTINTTRDAAVQTINTTRDAAVQTVNNAAETAEDAAVESIEQAAAEKVDEINGIGTVRFDGYQPLTEDEQATARSNIDAGGAIVETAQGNGVVTVEDSAHAALHGLRIFGKSTQDGTPSPDAPVPIVSVGDDGAVEVGLYGDNLLENSRIGETYTTNGITFTVRDDGSVLVNGTATTTAYLNLRAKVTLYPGIYALSGTPQGGNDSTYIIQLYNAATNKVIVSAGTLEITHRFDTKTNVYGMITIRTGATVNNLVFYPKLAFRGRTGNDYTKPVKAHYCTVSTPNGLLGIPVDSGGNYTDADGQQWVCDEVDFGRGVYVQRIMRYTFDGSSDERWYAAVTSETNTSGHYRNVSNELSKLILSPADSRSAGILLCTRYVNKPSGGQGSWGEIVSINIEINGAIIVYDTTYNTDDITQWTAWLAENPMDIVYALATPIETPLTAEELAAYRALRTQYPITNVINDEGAGMEIAYTADTKTYIDNKFAELSAAIINA